ncbi:Oxalate--CoA ligase [Fulvia fulva]|uniref:Oxalate--CoA ligase n=1 Tax=Passalora fulva TaxID=5499 RepID=A0A9Q8PIS0_PASFU|nr:Oxalate--CoA ligase [Fulvia fulva]KAK4611934.1 Oxalate--CoA ligase [Fulvia fulva]KAK4612497.1 Oxalate--CoA ligase [Fulvia fulva]UJO23414.1 Oxalate--CoA ligase [Fulvia fulva]WPV21314.1 Oxalate--CoA ligase [Fulvia fulva]WPV36018.1 Oxalate--CoA ligase [Fulvia fulva]
MPLFHIHGLVAGLSSPLASGGAVIFTPKTASFLRDAVTHGATWYTGTPTLHRLAAQMPMKEKPGFRFVRSCSSRLEGGLAKQLGERYGCPVVEAYAMTEAAHQVCSNPVDAAGTREGSVGKPTRVNLKILDDGGSEVAVGEIGEVCIKGENVMAGYMDNEEANAKSFTSRGFFRTGDQGKVMEDGFVVLTGRIKELVNKGGEKISPVEIDNVINQHPDVEEGVAFAMPDEMYGEDVGAAVILKSGADLGEKELKAYVGERLLQAKVPKKVFFVTEIPKTPVGKMQRGLVAKTMLGESDECERSGAGDPVWSDLRHYTSCI